MIGIETETKPISTNFLTKRQIELLENINIGIAEQKDLQHAMKITSAAISQIKGRLLDRNLVFDFQFFNRIDEAIAMRRETTLSWQEISERLGYRNPLSAYTGVRHRISGNIKFLRLKSQRHLP